MKYFSFLLFLLTASFGHSFESEIKEQSFLHDNIFSLNGKPCSLFEQRIFCARCCEKSSYTYESAIPIVSVINNSYGNITITDFDQVIEPGHTFHVPAETFSLTFHSERSDGEFSVLSAAPATKKLPGKTALASSSFKASGGYPYNPFVDFATWEHLTPYFLPEDHPIKEKLDRLFSSRISASKLSLTKAGFSFFPSGISLSFVAKHPSLDGYLLKLYTDEQVPKRVDWYCWERRIIGRNAIKNAIARHNADRFFKVPKKWIYPLPADPSPPAGTLRKNFVLVVENMNILSKRKNEARWGSSAITRTILNKLYLIIQEEGLNDSVLAFNIPFSKDGKIAFVDTERHHHWPIHYEKLEQYLSSHMKKYWRKVVNNNGPVAIIEVAD